MKISLNWLNQYLSNKLSVEEAEIILTNVGLEVEDITKFESIKGGLKGLVIGEVIEKEKHTDADKLSVTKVDLGTGELFQIVCGAPNVAAGQKVVVATPGTTLYNGDEKFEIKKSKIRGVESNGMICAEDEIGIGQSHDGIIVLPSDTPIGTLASDYFKVESDYILEINITPNRPDATSHIGAARDIVAFQKIKDANATLLIPNIQKNELDNSKSSIKIEIENIDACPRYSGIVINNIEVKDSPQWLKNKIESVGLRSINNIVDITNYVQFEFGHPLHAFDLSKIKNQKLVIRSAKENEKLITLDDIERKLNSSDLMICDTEKPLCIAGVFGGKDSGVSLNTTSIFIESAYFNPVSIRKTSKLHGLKTDASFRFERGTDPNITIITAQRAAELIVQVAGGNLECLVDYYPIKIPNNIISFNILKSNKIIGVELRKDTVISILNGLGFKIISEENEILKLEVPAYKVDVTREIDVVEEIIRIYGLNEIPINENLSVSYTTKPKSNKIREKITNFLVNNNYYEILTNSLSYSAHEQKNNGSVKEDVVFVLNPISSELDILRNELIYSGLNVVNHNLNFKNKSISIFEFARTYHIDMSKESDQFRNNYFEKNKLGIWLCGDATSEAWYSKSDTVGFFHLKGIVSSILDLLSIPTLPIVEKEIPNFQNGFEIYGFKNKNKPMIQLGLVSSKIIKNHDIKLPVFYAEIDLEVLNDNFTTTFSNYKPIAKFPSVRRDLALVVDKNVKYEELKTLAFKTDKSILKEVSIFDVYEGKGIDPNKKSYALSFTFQDANKTLTDNEIEKVISKLIEQYEKQVQAEIRN